MPNLEQILTDVAQFIVRVKNTKRRIEVSNNKEEKPLGISQPQEIPVDDDQTRT